MSNSNREGMEVGDELWPMAGAAGVRAMLGGQLMRAGSGAPAVVAAQRRPVGRQTVGGRFRRFPGRSPTARRAAGRPVSPRDAWDDPSLPLATAGVERTGRGASPEDVPRPACHGEPAGGGRGPADARCRRLWRPTRRPVVPVRRMLVATRHGRQAPARAGQASPAILFAVRPGMATAGFAVLFARGASAGRFRIGPAATHSIESPPFLSTLQRRPGGVVRLLSRGAGCPAPSSRLWPSSPLRSVPPLGDRMTMLVSTGPVWTEPYAPSSA
jgi:hypothetical protein